MELVEKDLGGYFKWFVVDESLTLVDPKYLEEYKSLPKLTEDKPICCPV